jgi:putative nucleotidyltransferase with HDIG domain
MVSENIVILAIDDNKDNLVVLKAMIADSFSDANFLSAKDGEEGISMAKEFCPDVILLDILMPGLDGFQTCRIIKEDNSINYIPIVFMTALKTSSESRVKALEAGAEGFLSKPVDEIELTVQIKAMVKVKKANEVIRHEKEHLKMMVAVRTREIAQSEMRYKSLFDNMLEGFAYCKMLFEDNKPADFIYLEVNEKFEELTGLKNVVGKKGSEAIAGLRETNPELIKTYGRVAMTGKPARFETYIRDLDMWFLLSAYCPEKGYFVVVFDIITERKRAEEKLMQSYKKIESTLDSAIMTIASICEARDPYIAGHQLKVAQLACAIAEEIGLPDDTIKNLKTAAILHDIGKINIPASILAKPGKLTDIEFAMIKSHSQTGYDIIKTMDMPLSISTMILQHHERIDGSGYPGGLKNGEILLESKILVVSDVTEAMTSHRPYRPALGTDAAMDEISKNRGILYDTGISDACLKIFYKKGFKFL